MPILFSAVAFERKIVCHFACCDGNFMDIAEQVVYKLPPGDKKMTYLHGTYLLHYIANDKYIYFCITDKLCQRSRTFLFLNAIQRRFVANKELDKNATTTLAEEMYRYSEDYSTITVRKGELDELNKIGVGCSEELLGEKILYINNPDNISYSKVSLSAGKTMQLYCLYVGIGLQSAMLGQHVQYMLARLYETISYVGCTPEQVSVSVVPRWYIVIIGMVLLVISMAVYTFGPVSCGVVTLIGIYLLLQSRTASKNQ